MDINEQLQPIITSIIDSVRVSIEDEVRAKVNQEIINRVASTEINDIIHQVTVKHLDHRLSQHNFEATSKKEIDAIIKRVTDNVNNTLVKSANEQIANAVTRQLNNVDITAVISSLVETKVRELVSGGAIPNRSIPHTTIEFKGFTLSGDQIKGGIIQGFGSTGIEDLAKSVKLSVLDNLTVSENPLVAPAASIKGKLAVDGDLVLKGSINADSPAVTQITELATARVKEGLNEELFQGFSNLVSKNINEQGLDLNIIKQGGREVVNNNQLGYHIVDSNLQRLGLVRDLQTQGETLLCDTLYVTGRRVGVNTMDPSSTLTVWDDEVEIVAEKRSQDTGFVGTKRHQRIVLGSNSKDNITLNTDGTVEIASLSIGNVPMSSASVAPSYEAITGTIVWNESAGLGGYAGWICIGGARWAKFGKIE